MDWREKTNKEKRERELLETMVKRWREELLKSGLLELIENVKTDVEKATGLKYAFGDYSEHPHFNRASNSFCVHRIPASHYFCLEAKSDGIFLRINPSGFIKPKKIIPREITEQEVYQWFEHITEG
jgi:hypothetical protein